MLVPDPSDPRTLEASNATMNSDDWRRSRLCLGFGIVCLVFLWETVVAHRHVPSPASPYVWALLGGGAVVLLGLAAWFDRRSKRR